jgi:hypothetical protein
MDLNYRFTVNNIYYESWFIHFFREAILKPKKISRLHVIDAQMRGNLGFAGILESKMHFLIAFAVLYGLIFINYIDIASSGLNYGYHVWLALMYFLPFAGFSMLNFKNWKLTVGLGFTASLMNDVFYGSMRYLVGMPYDLGRYYSLWLIPQNTVLFKLNLGFTVLPVYSWMMAISIYMRVILVYFLLKSWKSQAKIIA